MNKESVRNLFNNAMRFNWVDQVIERELLKFKDNPYLMGYADCLKDNLVKFHLTKYIWSDILHKYVLFNMNNYRKNKQDQKIVHFWKHTNYLFDSDFDKRGYNHIYEVVVHNSELFKLSVKDLYFTEDDTDLITSSAYSV